MPASLTLAQAEEQPGFTDGLLNILEQEQNPSLRLSSKQTPLPAPTRSPSADVRAAVVYLKNRVSKGWSPADEYSQAKPIPDEEKASFRNRLVPVLVASPPQVRVQLIPTLQKILAYDFPAKWPDFLDITIQLLNAGDIASVFAGVQCLLAICKIYRFKSGENRADFDKIVALSFPQLLNIGNSLANETSLEAGEILRTVLKVYKHAIYVRDPRTEQGGCFRYGG